MMKKLNPLLCAALGAAAAYYALMPVFTSRFALVVPGLVFALAAAALWLCRKTPGKLLLIRAAAAGFLLGTAALAASFHAGRFLPGLPAEAVRGVQGRLLDDPRVTGRGSGTATLELEKAAGDGGVRTSARGRVTVFFSDEAIPRLKEFGRGSRVFLEGKLSVAEDGRRFFRAASTHIVSPPSGPDRLRTAVRLKLIDIFSRGSWGGLSLALLLGVKDNLDGELSAKYRDSGCSYILALSGMHLALVSAIIAFLLRRPLGVKAAATSGAVFIIVYIYLVGAQPSLVRAGIAYIAGAVGILCLARVKALNLLALSFLVQIVIAPESARSVSFVLSYLALAGILLLGEPIYGLLRGRLPDFAARPLSASLGAFIATTAVSAAIFGTIRVSGIFAGLVMVPLTTAFMVASIIYLALNLIVPPLAGILYAPFDYALSLLYRAPDFIAGTAARFPGIAGANTPFFITTAAVLPFVIMYVCRARLKARCVMDKIMI